MYIIHVCWKEKEEGNNIHIIHNKYITHLNN